MNEAAEAERLILYLSLSDVTRLPQCSCGGKLGPPACLLSCRLHDWHRGGRETIRMLEHETT